MENEYEKILQRLQSLENGQEAERKLMRRCFAGLYAALAALEASLLAVTALPPWNAIIIAGVMLYFLILSQRVLRR